MQAVGCGTRLPREAVEHPCLRTLGTRLDTALSKLMELNLLLAGGWTRKLLEVPSSQHKTVIFMNSLCERSQCNFSFVRD